LGVAAYTFEIGTAFFQACNDFENTILPENMPALLYGFKAARRPYQTPAGPEVHSISCASKPQPTQPALLHRHHRLLWLLCGTALTRLRG